MAGESHAGRRLRSSGPAGPAPSPFTLGTEGHGVIGLAEEDVAPRRQRKRNVEAVRAESSKGKGKAAAAAAAAAADYSDEDPAPSKPRKRKMEMASAGYGEELGEAPPAKQRKKTADTTEEKRLRRFRAQPTQSFNDVYSRALSQRFYVLDRHRAGTDECPEEVVKLTGSTGNVYTIHIERIPTCDCPWAQKGNQCKHVIYVLSRVLNAPVALVYQLALLSSELRSIFAGAPPIDAPEAAKSNNRKDVDGECPICFSELDAKSPESIVWCKAACGQNIHQECFGMWARTKGTAVTCPFCRSPWQGADPSAMGDVQRNGQVNEEGYVNVAGQLGISGIRDVSSYSEWSPFGYFGSRMGRRYRRY